ncbi:MAG TPA: PQQ-binding-like beta-propeller repeat protein [Gaiellaceae bacterium]|nr:PQQ-binding-like beta-propeller repeat protein [Gaiellaceae bacterium]
MRALLALAVVWTSANGGLASQRSTQATMLDARTIPHLIVRWRFRLRSSAHFGAITANAIIRGNIVYIQDSRSSVYAVDVRSGRLLWKHTIVAPNDGPNGLTVSGSRVYAETDTAAFALDATTGRRVWSRQLTNQFEQFVAIAPVVDRGRVYVSRASRPAVAGRSTRSTPRPAESSGASRRSRSHGHTPLPAAAASGTR